MTTNKQLAWANEIQLLTNMLNDQSQGASEEVRGRCEYALAKLHQAEESLSCGDEGGAWVHALGAVAFTQMLGLDVKAVRGRVDRLLDSA